MSVMPRATDIATLVRRLGSRRDATVDAARARLCAKGTRAVDALIAALEGGSTRVLAHAMPILSLLRDPRGREPLTAMLLDRDARVREIAARCLARYPSPSVAAALERLTRRDRNPEVRVAAVRSLLEQYAAGQERAIAPVLTLLCDPSEDARARMAAMSLVPMLRSVHRRGVLKRLRQDPNATVARRALEIEATGERRTVRDESAMRGLVRSLASEDYAVWNDAVHRLVASGPHAVEPLVAEMQRRAHDPEYCARAGMALVALGPARARSLVEALGRVEEPVPLQVLVEVVGALGEKALIYRLKDLIERIATGVRTHARVNGFDPLQRVRARAHLELARVGSRVAIDDLRSILADPDLRMETEIPSALELIGTRDELADLLRAWSREDRFMRERIASAVRAIARRERIRRSNAIFRSLAGGSRRAFESIFPPRRSRGRADGPARH